MEYFFTFAILVTFFITVMGLVTIASEQKKIRNGLRSSLDTISIGGINQEHLRKLMFNYARHLQKLREKQALYGLDAPAHLLTEIEDIEAEIEELQKLIVTFSGLTSLTEGSDEQTKRTDN